MNQKPQESAERDLSSLHAAPDVPNAYKSSANVARLHASMIVETPFPARSSPLHQWIS
ncbi:hypothetical protein ACWCSD_34130 [Nonomuraea sp. NPDC001684]